MAAMSESFVDLSYRGLSLARRIRLTRVRSSTGYLELPTPMPVGTTIAITTDDGLALEATVAEIHEQVGGLERAPGMLVTPRLEGAAQTAWWQARVAAHEVAQAPPEVDKAPPPADSAGKVTVKSRRTSGAVAVPELIDDGRNTAVMEAISEDDARASGGMIADVAEPGMSSPRDTNPSLPAGVIADDGRRTVAMDAVDLAALGLSSASGQFAAVRPEDYVDDDARAAPAPADSKSDGKPAKKKRKRR
jgi:hypothetical protein